MGTTFLLKTVVEFKQRPVYKRYNDCVLETSSAIYHVSLENTTEFSMVMMKHILFAHTQLKCQGLPP